MYIKNRVTALIYRSVLLIVCGVGLYITLGFYRGQFSPYSLVYYTTLSNLICFIFYLPMILHNAIKLRSQDETDAFFAPRIKGAVVIMITITLTIYHAFLANSLFSIYSGGDLVYFIQNLIVHYIVPIMVILDWILFDPKQMLRPLDPVLCLMIPAAYAAFAIIRAKFGDVLPGLASRYPYFFMDFDLMGYGRVVGFFAVFLVIYLGVGYGLWILDSFVLRKRVAMK